VINEEHGDRPTREESIWELADMLASEMLDFANGLREAYHMSKNSSRSPPARTGTMGRRRSEDNNSYTFSSG
jgi:hypothetical protein